MASLSNQRKSNASEVTAASTREQLVRSGKVITTVSATLSEPVRVLPCTAKHHNDLRSDHDPNSRTHKQNDPDSDVMQVAWAFMPIAPSGPSSYDPCRCAHTQKNGPGIDDRNNHEGHAAETQAMCAPDITSQRKQRPCDNHRTATQPQLLTCRELDGRTSAAKAFDRLAFGLATRRQLGGISGQFSSIPVIRGRYPDNEQRIATHSLRRKMARSQRA